MINIRDMGIKPKLIIINAFFVIILIGALTAVFLRYSKMELTENLEHDSLSFSKYLAHNSALALLSRNRELAGRYIDGLLKDQDVVYGALYFGDGTLFIEKNKEGYSGYEAPEINVRDSKFSMVRKRKHGVYPIIEASSPVLLDRIEGGREEIVFLSDMLPFDESTAIESEIAGVAVVALSAERPMERFLALSSRWLMIALIISAVVIAMILIAINRFTGPLINLSLAAERVAGGDLDVAIASGSRDEIGVLAEAFNDMIGSIKANMTEIKESQSEIEAIFDGITDYIWVVDTDCTLVRANRMFAAKVGIPVHEITGKRCEDIVFLGESFCRVACPMKSFGVAGGLSNAAEFTDSETGRIFQMRTFPLLSSDNKFRGGINYLKDISETKMMEKRLIQSEKLTATGRLAADVAHEVNNPLGIIKNYLTMLKREMKGKNPEVIENLDVIDEEISRIADIIKGLLAFSRPESKDQGFADVNRTIENIVTLIGNSMKKHGVSFDMGLDPSIPEIKISSGHLKQVMINLINNSLDAMPDGGELSVRTFDRKDGVVIDVEDSGVGIRDGDMKELFTPFYTTKGVKGTGLGLAISYGIVKGYGGDINLRSKDEKGVIASVYLPYKSGGTKND